MQNFYTFARLFADMQYCCNLLKKKTVQTFRNKVKQ